MRDRSVRLVLDLVRDEILECCLAQRRPHDPVDRPAIGQLDALALLGAVTAGRVARLRSAGRQELEGEPDQASKLHPAQIAELSPSMSRRSTPTTYIRECADQEACPKAARAGCRAGAWWLPGSIGSESSMLDLPVSGLLAAILP